MGKTQQFTNNFIAIRCLDDSYGDNSRQREGLTKKEESFINSLLQTKCGQAALVNSENLLALRGTKANVRFCAATIKDIAELTGINRTTVHRNIKKLKDKGMIKEVSHPLTGSILQLNPMLFWRGTSSALYAYYHWFVTQSYELSKEAIQQLAWTGEIINPSTGDTTGVLTLDDRLLVAKDFDLLKGHPSTHDEWLMKSKNKGFKKSLQNPPCPHPALAA